jgi:aminopeptidase N
MPVSRPDRIHATMAARYGLTLLLTVLASCAPTTQPEPESVAALSAYTRPWTEPGAGDVLHYELELEVDPRDEWIEGRVVMTVLSAEPELQAFRINLMDDLTMTSVRVDGRPAAWRRIDERDVDIDLGRPRDRGASFRIAVAYEGEPTTEGFGSIAFRSHNTQPIVYTLSQPWNAPTWWPVKDDNADKATVSLSVTAPDRYTAVANGQLLGVDALPDDRRRYRYATQYATAPYLVFFSATNYELIERTVFAGGRRIPMRFYNYPEDRIRMEQAIATVVEAMPVFTELFGPYPFADEGYGIYQFGFGGGMEHQGLSGQGNFDEWLTVHELAHQWWGDMITCETWHDAWLNEGFATYGQALFDEFRPGAEPDDLEEAMQWLRPSRVDGSVYVHEPTSSGRIFSMAFSYRKGAWVLHQLRRIVGDDDFFEILRVYRERFEYDVARTEDFIDVAEAVQGRDLSWYFDPWLYEPGAPRLAFDWLPVVDGSGRTTAIELRLAQVQRDDWPTYRMPLDVLIEWDGGTHMAEVWMDAREQTITIPLDSIDGGVTNVTLDPDGWLLHDGIERLGD